MRRRSGECEALRLGIFDGFVGGREFFVLVN